MIYVPDVEIREVSEEWLRVRATLQEHIRKRKGEKLPEYDSFGDLIPEVAEEMTVTQSATEVDFAELPAAPGRFATRAAEAGWKTLATISQTHHPETKYVGDSKTTDAKAGDIKAPPHDEKHFVVRGALAMGGQRAAWFLITYDEKPATAKGVPILKNTFGGARFWDLVSDEKMFAAAVTPFDEWFTIFAPKPEPKTPKKQKLSGEAALLAGEDFRG